ncbi:hypothetical protein NPIL_106001, partial [Nephila pilipes]
MFSFNFSYMFYAFMVAIIVLLNVIDISEAGAGAYLHPGD